jgi:radical SAM superfamily enzyme YgiQ (UPF0313 family)
MVPILEGVKTINSYGMEVVSGIILGLDTDKPGTSEAILQFVDESKIPLFAMNLLQALPKTPLWDRLSRENRLIHDEDRESNVDFLLPYGEVVESWRHCMKVVFEPEALFARYLHQVEYTFRNRIKPPASPQRRNWTNIRRAIIMLRNIFWKVGVRGHYRKAFWKFAFACLRRGELEGFIAGTIIAHHAVVYGREASEGRRNASNYSLRMREAA